MKPAHITVICSLFSAVMVASFHASAQTVAQPDGKSILESRCGRCHSVAKVGRSPLGNAPPFRDIFRRYRLEQLEFELSEGVGSRHKEMPQIQFSAEQIDQILIYLRSITESN
jgi:mono/diheme cytochrome c family protein